MRKRKVVATAKELSDAAGEILTANIALIAAVLFDTRKQAEDFVEKEIERTAQQVLQLGDPASPLNVAGARKLLRGVLPSIYRSFADTLENGS